MEAVLITKNTQFKMLINEWLALSLVLSEALYSFLHKIWWGLYFIISTFYRTYSLFYVAQFLKSKTAVMG